MVDAGAVDFGLGAGAGARARGFSLLFAGGVSIQLSPVVFVVVAALVPPEA